MAHEPRFPTAPTEQEIQRIIAQAHQMRADHAAGLLRKAVSFVTSVFHRSGTPADTSA